MVLMVAVYPEEANVVVLCEFRNGVNELASECLVYPIAEVATRNYVRSVLVPCFLE